MILVMNTTTLDIYNLLVDAGIEAKKAEPLAKEILTRSEAREYLATKNDLYIMAFAIIGTNLAGVAMLLQFFS